MFFSVAALGVHAVAQTVGPGPGIPPCTTFGTTAGTCIQGAGALGTPLSGNGTNITNVNAATLGGATFASPGTIGGSVAGSVAASTITASGIITSTANGGGSTSSFIASSAGPSYAWNNTSATTDTKVWDMAPTAGGLMQFRLLNDANNSALSWMTIQRTGISAAVVAFPAIGTDSGLSDSNACIATTGKAIVTGTGTLGVCLGTSSERYKHGLSRLAPGLKEILALHPKQGYLNADHGDPTKMYYWITAEDAKPVLSRLVGLDKFGRPNSMDLVGLIPVLVNAIQQQQAEITALQQERNK